MPENILKRNGSKEPFDGEKLLASLKHIIRALKIKDNPVSKRIFKRTLEKINQSQENHNTLSSQDIRTAVTQVLIDSDLKSIADYYATYQDKKIPLVEKKQTYIGEPVKAQRSGIKIKKRWTKAGINV